MTTGKNDLTKLRELLHSALVEVEMALDTATYPDWAITKESLLKALEIARKLERDQVWSKLGKNR
jgi:hypothetical protein